MIFSTRSVRRFALLATTAIALSGCQNMNKTQQGAALGAGLGGLAGAILGHQTGNRELGALIGAGTGAVAGGLVGNAKDANDERDAANAQAYHEKQRRVQAQRSVTNRDIINMSQGGQPEQTIINAIHERGGRLDTSPDQLNNLKENGVSNIVIQAMQSYNSRRY